MTRSLSLAHLTFLHLSPPELIHLAAKAGFDAVGLRLIAVNDTTPGYPLMDDPRMMADTLGALRDTGIRVNDIEFVRLTPDFNPSAMAPFLAAGARLGARYIVTAPYDPNLDRLSQNLARFAEISAAYRLSPVLEFFPWTSVPDLSTALKVVDKTGSDDVGVLLDTLHFDRSESSLMDIVGAPASRFPFLHLCDAEVTPPYTESELLRTAREARLIPGDGDIVLRDILHKFSQDVPVALEIPMPRQSGCPSDEMFAMRMAQRVQAFLQDLDLGRSSK